MGVLRTLLTLPVRGPLDGTLWIAGKVQETAERELHDPAAIRAAFRQLEEKLLAGEISDEAYDAAETELLRRLREAS